MKPAARRRARECAIQALYAWQLSNNDIADIELHFLTEQDVSQVDVAYFREILAAVANQAEQFDQQIAPFLSRTVNELGAIEKAILRLACYELSLRSDIPYKVTINESIELAKKFGAQESHKFINGVLDKAAPTLRPAINSKR